MRNSDTLVPVNVYLPDYLLRWLDEQALREGCSKSAVVRRILAKRDIEEIAAQVAKEKTQKGKKK